MHFLNLKFLSLSLFLVTPLLTGASQSMASYGYFAETYVLPREANEDFNQLLRWYIGRQGIFELTFLHSMGKNAVNYKPDSHLFTYTWTHEFLDGTKQSELFTLKIPKENIDPSEEMMIVVSMRYRENASRSFKHFGTCYIYSSPKNDSTIFSDKRLPPYYNQHAYVYHFGGNAYKQAKKYETIKLYNWKREASLVNGHIPLDFYFEGQDFLGNSFEVSGVNEELRIYSSRISDFDIDPSYRKSDGTGTYLSFLLTRKYNSKTNKTSYKLKDTFYVSHDGRRFADKAHKTREMLIAKSIYLPSIKDYGSDYYEIHLVISNWAYFKGATFDGVMEIWKSRNFFGGKGVSDFYIAEGKI